VRIRLNYEVKKIFWTYTGIGDRADTEESRPVRSEAAFSALLQQLILKGQLAKNGSRRRCGSPDVEPPHRPGCRLGDNRLGHQIRNRGRRQLHKRKIIKAY
jgi:hypothetical protein